ncbi:uncharacterized [Tachysurus ichikawai]
MRIKAVESVLRGHRTSPHRVLALEQVYVTFLSSEEKRIQPGSEALHHQEILCLLWTGFSRFWTSFQSQITAHEELPFKPDPAERACASSFIDQSLTLTRQPLGAETAVASDHKHQNVLLLFVPFV